MTTQWAQGPQGSNSDDIDWNHELHRGLEKFAWISPVSSLHQVGQGDVLLSTSGNMRLVLGIKEQGSDGRLTFLTRLETGRLRLESAMRSKIDKARVSALIVRKEGNPLSYFSDLAENLTSYKSVLQNVEVLLMTGQLGDTLREEVYQRRTQSNRLLTIHCGVSPVSGIIRVVGAVDPASSHVPVGLQLSGAQLPGDEYIENALFYGAVEGVVRTSILAAAVIANTIQNAHNLIGLRMIAERKGKG